MANAHDALRLVSDRFLKIVRLKMKLFASGSFGASAARVLFIDHHRQRRQVKASNTGFDSIELHKR